MASVKTATNTVLGLVCAGAIFVVFNAVGVPDTGGSGNESSDVPAKGTIPSLSPGDHEVIFAASWKNGKPAHIILTYLGNTAVVREASLDGGNRGSWDKKFPYVRNQRYNMSVMSQKDDGTVTCAIFIDGEKRSTNTRTGYGSIRCSVE